MSEYRYGDIRIESYDARKGEGWGHWERLPAK